MNHEDQRFMRLAIEQAMSGIGIGQSPFGACLVKDGEIICCVHNIALESYDATGHAETHAVRSACKMLRTIDLSGTVLYATSEPCPMCFTACHWAKIPKIVYGTSVDEIIELGFRQPPISSEKMNELCKSSIEIVGGFMRDECLELFRAWESSSGRVVY